MSEATHINIRYHCYEQRRKPEIAMLCYQQSTGYSRYYQKYRANGKIWNYHPERKRYEVKSDTHKLQLMDKMDKALQSI